MSFGILHISPGLAEFAERHPELSIDMKLDDQQVDLVEEGFDLAIRIVELPDSSLVACNEDRLTWHKYHASHLLQWFWMSNVIALHIINTYLFQYFQY